MGCGSSFQEDQMRLHTPIPVSNRFIIPPPESVYDDLDSRQTSIDNYSTSSYFDGILHHFDSVHESAEKSKQFYSLLGNRMGELYTNTLAKIQDKLIKQQIGTDDLKVTFSKTILLHILNMINKLQQRPNWKTEKITIFERIAKCQIKIIQFLEFKYPRNKKDFIPTELEEIFSSVDDSQHTDYDLLINSGINFDYQRIQSYERIQVIRQIKKLINQLILETNRSFEYFRETMENIFSNTDGTFKIGRKISENVSTYKDLDSGTMQIHSPEIFRVIIKFISYVDGVFINTLEVLKKKKYFKILELDGQDYSYFPLYTGKNQLISVLTSALEPGSKAYLKQQQDQQVSLANFNDNLAKILTKKTHIPEINQNQIKTIKYAKYISKFVQFLAIQKLIYLITELVNLRQKMDKKNRKAVDLIYCSINDLLRCQFMGSKKSIIDVFGVLKDMQKSEKIKIIRVKNRFATPLNDVLVNFKFIGQKQSFLVCQLQLILKKTGFEGNAKFESLAKVNHVLYELQRSIFGPMAEMSLLLTHNDTRMGYQKKIKLQKSYLNSMRCPDKQILSCEYDLSIPYVCSLCTQFYHMGQNNFPIHRCQNCNYYVCPKCLFSFDPELSEQCYLKQIFALMKEKFLPEMDENEDMGFFFFNKKYHKVSDIKRQGKNFFDCLEQKMVEEDEDFAFVVRFIEGNRYFNTYHRHNNGELLPTFYDFLPRFQRKDFRNHSFSQYDIVLFLDPSCTVQLKPSKDHNLASIPLTNVEVNLRLIPEIYYFKSNDTFWMIDIGDQQRDNDSVSVPTSSADKSAEIQKILDSYKPRDGQLLLDYLDISVVHFGEKVIQNLRFVKIRSNRIRDISPILKYQSLEEIDASRNELSQLKLNKLYKKLRILDFSQNFIENVKGISNQTVPDLKQLNLENNLLKKFPTFSLSKLLWLNLSQNRIDDIQGFIQSEVPKLRKLAITKNSIRQIPMNSQMKELLDLQAQKNEITSIQFLFCCPKIQQVYLYENQITEYPQNLRLFYLQKLDLSHNKLTDLRNLTSSQFPIIKEMDFSENKIKQIPKLSFETLQILSFRKNQLDDIHNLYKSENLESLVKIDLSQNKIAQFCILVMEVLEELNLSQNKIKDMTSLVHCKLPALKKLDLSDNQIQSMVPIDQPALIRLNLQTNQLASMEALSHSNFASLQYLNLANNKIKKFVAAIFPSLQQLIIKRNQLTQVTSINSEQLIVLKTLDMSENKIRSLPYLSLQSVEKFSLERNDISSLETFKNSNLPHLAELDLRFNELQSFPIMKLPELSRLLLDSNQINDLKQLSQCDMPLLQELRLPNNKLTKLQVLKLPKLSILNLQRNDLTNIDILEKFDTPQIMEIKMTKNFVKKLCSLKSNSLNLIDLSFNKVSEGLNLFFQSSLPKLMTIKLSNNALQGGLPKMKDFPSLKFLDVSKNSINSLQEFLTSSLPKLDTLKLNNNKISSLGEAKLPKLKQLDLSNNKISIIEDFLWSQIPKIGKLFLQNNQLDKLPNLEFNSLMLLNLQGNKIESLTEFQKSTLPSLQKLYMNRNLIKEWPKQFYLDKLVRLNLSDNCLTSFENLDDEYVPELTQLILKKNNIQKIHEINLPHLLVLNLEGNPVTLQQKLIKQGITKNSFKNGKVNKKLKWVTAKKTSDREVNQNNMITKLKNQNSVM